MRDIIMFLEKRDLKTHPCLIPPELTSEQIDKLFEPEFQRLTAFDPWEILFAIHDMKKYFFYDLHDLHRNIEYDYNNLVTGHDDLRELAELGISKIVSIYDGDNANRYVSEEGAGNARIVTMTGVVGDEIKITIEFHFDSKRVRFLEPCPNPDQRRPLIKCRLERSTESGVFVRRSGEYEILPAHEGLKLRKEVLAGEYTQISPDGSIQKNAKSYLFLQENASLNYNRATVVSTGVAFGFPGTGEFIGHKQQTYQFHGHIEQFPLIPIILGTGSEVAQKSDAIISKDTFTHISLKKFQ